MTEHERVGERLMSSERAELYEQLLKELEWLRKNFWTASEWTGRFFKLCREVDRMAFPISDLGLSRGWKTKMLHGKLDEEWSGEQREKIS